MNPRSLSRPVALSAIALATCAALLFTACSSSSSSSATFKRNNIVVSDVQARESVAASGMGVVYFTIENTSATADKLFSASVSKDFAKSASIHETVLSGGATATTMALDSSSETTMVSGQAAMMSMQPVNSVTIPANGTVTFEPGGLHIMLEGLVAPLKNGQTFDLNLGFLNGGVIKVTATVKAS
ncbi:MAG: copper chaperone PCu(A)C [Acidimicrobiales bacterium]